MSKRLQVLLDEREFEEIRRRAKLEHMTVAEWVRQTLRAAGERGPEKEIEHRLTAVRTAMSHSFPTGDIDQLLRETEAGYLTETGR